MEKCEFCGKECKNKKGVASHRRFSSECETKWLEKQKIIEEKRYENGCFVLCKECNDGIPHKIITNTHLKKHNMTMKEYKIKWRESCFSKDTLKTQCDNREKTLHIRYPKEEIHFLRGKKSVKSKLDNFERENGYRISYSEFQSIVTEVWQQNNPEKARESARKAGQKIHEQWESLSKEKRKEKSDKRVKQQQETEIKKYGCLHQQLESCKKKTEETKMWKYGEGFINISKYRESMFKKFGKYSNFYPRFSIESQDLFKEIEAIIKIFDENFICKYATNGSSAYTNEQQIWDSKFKCVRYLDFFVPSLNKCIEFYEEHHEKDRQKTLDKERIEEIKNKNIEILIVRKKDFINSKDKVIRECLNFLLHFGKTHKAFRSPNTFYIVQSHHTRDMLCNLA